MSAGPRINYLCLQATQEGQASYAHVHEIINGLRKHGCEVNLAEVKPFPPGTSIATRFKTLQAIQGTFQKLPRPDLIYIRGHFLALPTALWAKRNQIPQIHEINGPYEDAFLAYPVLKVIKPMVEWETRFCYSRADALITVTPQLVKWAKKETKLKNVHEVPNGANTDIFKPGTPLEIKVPDRYVIFFGAMAAWQGIPTMLEAANHVAWPPGVSLLLAGDGVEVANVQKAAAKNPLIQYLGKVPYRKLPGVISRSIAGIAISKPREGSGLSPLKLYETMACGVPVIASDVEPMDALVRNAGAGLIVPKDDAGALAAAVRQLAAEPAMAKAMGDRGRKLVVEEHSWERRATDTYKIIEGMLKGGNRKALNPAS
ncbi:MAG: glycosyltransferase family 4 protein [Verrucomicrobiales bacterium]